MTEPRPLFESPPDADTPPRRALLFAYHFPPGQAAGALRWQKFVELGAGHGWAFDVLTAHPDALASADSGRLTSLPPGTRVFGVRESTLWIERLEALAWRAFSTVRSLLKRRASGVSNEEVDATPQSATDGGTGSVGRHELRFDWADIRSWWRAYQSLLEIARERAWSRRAEKLGQRIATPKHGVILSSSPPEMPHVAAARLAARLGVPFIADFRDPWSLRERLPEHLASPIGQRVARRLEEHLARRASKIVMNTIAARDAMRALYPARHDDIVAIPNGFDEDPLPAAEGSTDCFRIAYAGAVYLDRNPAVLLRAAASVIAALGLRPDMFSIEFMGFVSPRMNLEGMSTAAGVASFVHVRPAGTRSEAAAFLGRGSMLLNLPQDSHLAIPSKIYEYMRYGAHMLVLAEPQSATAALLAGSPADVVAPDDEEAIARVLSTRVQAWRRGERPRPISADARYSRATSARRLYALIETVVEA